MINVSIEVKGINELDKMFIRRPQLVKTYINKAIEASIFAIEKNAVDENFQFKTPRALRTGYLQRSFKFGIVTKDFYGSIGPTALYAQKVHEKNPFMSRIANASQPFIQKYFEQALGIIVEDLNK